MGWQTGSGKREGAEMEKGSSGLFWAGVFSGFVFILVLFLIFYG